MRQILSPYLKPTHYDLRIEPDLERATFEGAVTIEIRVLQSTSSIILHAWKLEIRTITLLDEDGNNLPIAGTRCDEGLQSLEILSETAMPENSKVILQLTFSGTLRTYGEGFHITPASLSGKSIASTNLEPCHARSVFPCFDDPSFKATFSITLVTPRHLMCLGNTPVKTVTELPGKPHIKRAIEFKETPIMPTYLVAFAIGEFNMIENNNFRIPIRAYAPHDFNIEECKYTLDIAARALKIFETTFQLECGLAKLDIVAIPGSDGGMENWGLVTVATGVLVISPDSSAAEKALSASMIAHELAHQWFGNLVTMTSWENFWVKEALSEWADANAREQMSGEEPWQEFVADGMQRALGFDASRFSHALEPSWGAGRSTAYFDEITYRKGCALLRMLADWLGKEVFLDGVRNYLKKHVYGNTKADDLWEALSAASGLDVGVIMKSWTEQVGYPVLDVVENQEDGIITVSQQRFILDGSRREEDTTLYTPIFLNILTPSGVLKEVLEDKSRTITFPLTSYYKINANQISFFRVAYSASHILKLSADLYKEVLSIPDRIRLVSDTSALAFACYPGTKTSTLLSLLQDFAEETNYFVWRTIISTLQTIKKNLLFEDKPFQHAFEAYQKDLVHKCLYRKGTFSRDDDLNETRFKAMMFGNSGGDEKVSEAAWDMFEKFLKGEKKAINPNIRGETFEIILREGVKKEYNELLSLLPTGSTPLRKSILSSLGYSQNSTCIDRTIKLAFSPTCISNNETQTVLESLTTHKLGVMHLYKFLAKGKWKKIPGMSFDNIAPIGQMILDSLTRKVLADGARKHLKGIESVSNFGNEIEKSFEGIDARNAWLERDEEDMTQWLKEKGFYNHQPRGRLRKVCEKLGCMK